MIISIISIAITINLISAQKAEILGFLPGASRLFILKNCRQFRLLTWTSLIGQFVHPVGGEGMG